MMNKSFTMNNFTASPFTMNNLASEISCSETPQQTAPASHFIQRS